MWTRLSWITSKVHEVRFLCLLQRSGTHCSCCRGAPCPNPVHSKSIGFCEATVRPSLPLWALLFYYDSLTSIDYELPIWESYIFGQLKGSGPNDRASFTSCYRRRQAAWKGWPSAVIYLHNTVFLIKKSKSPNTALNLPDNLNTDRAAWHFLTVPTEG